MIQDDGMSRVPSLKFQVPSSELKNRSGFRVPSSGLGNTLPGSKSLEPGTWHLGLGTRNWGLFREAGFTLLELLISMTILALIFVAVLGAIRVGSKSWESGELRAEENQRTRTLYDTLARDLTMLYPLRVKSQDPNKDIVVFRGKPDSLSFAALPQSYGAEPFSHMIRIVTYTVEPDLWLASAENYPLIGAEGASSLREGRIKGLEERVSEARFRYLVPEGRPEEKLPPTWRDNWDPSQDQTVPSLSQGLSRLPSMASQRPLQGSERLPLAVEITLTIRQANQWGARDLILPPLVFPVRVGQTL